MENRRPLIFDIKRGALEDGPGIRTTVFFKGCMLRCLWCQNPESLDPSKEIAFYPDECLKCGDCVAACRAGAIRLDKRLRLDRRKCDRCGDCVAACPSRALRSIGSFYEIEELTEILLRDRVFYEVSDGGVTLSGGEPTFHLDYVSSLLKELKRHDIHTAIQTNGFFDWQEFRGKVLDRLNAIMFDVKLADTREHRKYTGRSNRLILENLRRILQARPDAVLTRIPLIPRMTATAGNLRAISDLLKRLGVKRVALLPYNPTWFSKAASLGKSVSHRLSRQLLPPTVAKRCQETFSWAELVAP